MNVSPASHCSAYFLPMESAWDNIPMQVTDSSLIRNVHLAEDVKRVVLRSRTCIRPRFPLEVWSEILQHLDPCDLYHLSCADRLFYSLSIRPLLRSQRWNGIAPIAHYNALKDEDTSWRRDVVRILTLSSRNIDVFESLFDHFRHFSLLTSLRLHRFSFNPYSNVLQTLESFPQLTYVSFVSCSMPYGTRQDIKSFRSLSLRELDLLDLTWPPSLHRSDAIVRHRFAALHLLSAERLSIVRMDWTVPVAKHVLGRSSARHLAVSTVHTLELSCLASFLFGFAYTEFAEHTSRFLRMFVKLRHMRVIPPTSLPTLSSNPQLDLLHTYHGSMKELESLMVSDHIIHVVFSDTVDPLNLARYMPTNFRRVRSIMLNLSYWDDEVMQYALRAFPDVEDMRISYEGILRPSNAFLVVFPSRILPQLRNLRVLHLYSTTMPEALLLKPFDGFTDMKESGALGGLLEVRLELNTVWRRCSSADDDWRMRVERPPLKR